MRRIKLLTRIGLTGYLVFFCSTFLAAGLAVAVWAPAQTWERISTTVTFLLGSASGILVSTVAYWLPNRTDRDK